jgi:hypothetical protein
LNVTRAHAADSEASYGGSVAQTGFQNTWFSEQMALARRPNSGNMDRSWLSILQQ